MGLKTLYDIVKGRAGVQALVGNEQYFTQMTDAIGVAVDKAYNAILDRSLPTTDAREKVTDAFLAQARLDAIETVKNDGSSKFYEAFRSDDALGKVMSDSGSFDVLYGRMMDSMSKLEAREDGNPAMLQEMVQKSYGDGKHNAWKEAWAMDQQNAGERPYARWHKTGAAAGKKFFNIIKPTGLSKPFSLLTLPIYTMGAGFELVTGKR